MTPNEILKVALTVIASLGGGGAIVFGLSGYLGRVWADRALSKQKQEYAQLNIDFTHQLGLATRRLQTELDSIGHLRKLTVESELEKLNALWKSVAEVEITFGTLPKADFTLDNWTEEEQRQYCHDLAMRFSKAVNAARTVWRQEALSIPAHIETEAAQLLLVASNEQTSTLDHTFPLDATSFNQGVTQEKFFQLRASRCSEFLTKTNKLKDTIRKHLKSSSTTESPAKTQ